MKGVLSLGMAIAAMSINENNIIVTNAALKQALLSQSKLYHSTYH
jgi:hypothetical protein